MSQAVFADTFYYLALLNPNDAAHARAVAFSRRLDAHVVTTAWVIQELADALARVGTRATFGRLLTVLRADARTEVIPPTEATWSAGLALYLDRPDKDWSLTDCISFVVMQQHGLDEALTGDRHFAQAGFVAMLA